MSIHTRTALALALAAGLAAPAAAQTTAAQPAAKTTATTTKSAPQRTAKSLDCSKQADAKNIHGKARRHFMSSCKKG
jgi:predicted nicotinamide N-methyase